MVRTTLRQNLLDHVAAHVGQAEVSALEFVGEAFVVDAELVPTLRLWGVCRVRFGENLVASLLDLGDQLIHGRIADDLVSFVGVVPESRSELTEKTGRVDRADFSTKQSDRRRGDFGNRSSGGRHKGTSLASSKGETTFTDRSGCCRDFFRTRSSQVQK